MIYKNVKILEGKVRGLRRHTRVRKWHLQGVLKETKQG